MQYKSSVFVIAAFCLPAQAEELERLTITSCAYQAGTAREIQHIRQTEGDEWPVFEQKVRKIYSDTQGRTDLLAIAKSVYRQPVASSPDQIHATIFADCVRRTQGKEPSA